MQNEFKCEYDVHIYYCHKYCIYFYPFSCTFLLTIFFKYLDVKILLDYILQVQHDSTVCFEAVYDDYLNSKNYYLIQRLFHMRYCALFHHPCIDYKCCSIIVQCTHNIEINASAYFETQYCIL